MLQYSTVLFAHSFFFFISQKDDHIYKYSIVQYLLVVGPPTAVNHLYPLHHHIITVHCILYPDQSS